MSFARETSTDIGQQPRNPIPGVIKGYFQRIHDAIEQKKLARSMAADLRERFFAKAPDQHANTFHSLIDGDNLVYFAVVPLPEYYNPSLGNNRRRVIINEYQPRTINDDGQEEDTLIIRDVILHLNTQEFSEVAYTHRFTPDNFNEPLPANAPPRIIAGRTGYPVTDEIIRAKDYRLTSPSEMAGIVTPIERMGQLQDFDRLALTLIQYFDQAQPIQPIIVQQ